MFSNCSIEWDRQTSLLWMWPLNYTCQGNGCACEPSAHRPVDGSGGVPSAQANCCSKVGAGGEVVALNGCACEPSAHRPVDGSGGGTVSAG